MTLKQNKPSVLEIENIRRKLTESKIRQTWAKMAFLVILNDHQ